MKLHLPIKLFQAVMALFVTHTVVSTVWAEDKTITIPNDVVYSAENYDSSVWRELVNTTVTKDASATGAPSLTFSGMAGPAISANHLFIEDLGELTFSQLEREASEYDISGAAIRASYLQMNGNGNVSFNDNALSVMVDASVSSAGKTVEGGIVSCHGSVSEGDESVSVRITENGDVAFEGNSTYLDGTAPLAGGLIYASQNIIISDNAGVVKFNENATESTGGIVSGGIAYAASGSVNLERNAGVELRDNTVIASGGASGSLWSASAININDNGYVDIEGNTVEIKNGSGSGWLGGGAMMTGGIVNIEGNGLVNVSGNGMSDSKCQTSGGAIAAMFGVNIADNADVTFSGNSLTGSSSCEGGAIGSFGPVHITGNGVNAEGVLPADAAQTPGVRFVGNSIVSSGSVHGGAISSDNEYIERLVWNNSPDMTQDEVRELVDAECPAEVVLRGNGDVEFIDNSVSSSYDKGNSSGGAIYSSQCVVIAENGNVLFKSNSANASAQGAEGGAICSMGYVEITDNADVTFCYNSLNAESVKASAIAVRDPNADGNALTITGNHNVTFEYNQVIAQNGVYGGVISVDNWSEMANVVISDNSGAVKLNSNYSQSYSASVCGSFMENLSGGVFFENNAGGVELCNNIALANNLIIGGTIFAATDIIIDGNAGVKIEGNISGTNSAGAVGGVLMSYMGKVSISENTGEVIVKGNGLGVMSDVPSNAVLGSAICAQGGLSIVNNQADVTFEGNFELANSCIKLSSVYVQDGKVELSAAAGTDITFYDTIIINEGETEKDLVLNNHCAEGSHEAGSIVFSGAKIYEGLAAAQKIVGDYVGLEPENYSKIPVDVEASRLSSISRNLTVNAGALKVVDGALVGLLDDSEDFGVGYKLSVGEAELVLSSGSGIGAKEIVFSENSTLSLEASTFNLDEAATPAALMVAETVTFTGGMTISINGAYADLSGLGELNLDFSASNVLTLNMGDKSAIEREGQLYFVLCTGVNGLSGSELESITLDHNLTNCEDVTMLYHEETGTLYVRATPVPVPEPATATLSLLALAALAARRRRK